MNQNSLLGSLLGAVAVAFGGMIAGIGMAIAGVAEPPPIAVFVGCLFVAVVWVIVTLWKAMDHQQGEERRMNDAQATRIIAEAEAKTLLARAEVKRLQLQAAMVARSGDIREAQPAAIDESRLMSRAYTAGKRTVTVPLWRLKRLIEIYPATTRAAIKGAAITNGDQDCNDLMTVAELEGWIAKQGKGKEAQWAISPMQAKRAYMILVEDALNRARNGERSFDAPTPNNALIISAQPVYETSRQTSRQV